MKTVTILAVLALSGCATTSDFMERHPRASAVIAATVVTSIALSTRGSSNGADRHSSLHDPRSPGCFPQPDGSCR